MYNHYNDLDADAATTKAIDCGGDESGGKVQSYAEGDVPNLIDCSTKCNTCGTCAGFIDMLNDRKCHFMSSLDRTLVQIGTSSNAHLTKYWNKVKTYEACPVGHFSVDEAAFEEDDSCKACDQGKFSSRDTLGAVCFVCPPGKVGNATNNFETCLDCPAGKVSNDDESDCDICPASQYSDEATGRNSLIDGGCTHCPAGRISATPGATGNGDGKSCPICTRAFNDPSIALPGCLPCAADEMCVMQLGVTVTARTALWGSLKSMPMIRIARIVSQGNMQVQSVEMHVNPVLQGSLQLRHHMSAATVLGANSQWRVLEPVMTAQQAFALHSSALARMPASHDFLSR